MSQDNLILMFARAPIPGQTKTRLIPALGEQGAADLHQSMLTHLVKKFSHHATLKLQLWCAPDTKHPSFKQLSTDYSVELQTQQGDDLGQRMAHATQFAFNHAKTVILLGTDCPLIDKQAVEETATQLQQGKQVVVMPAEDGGYVMMGMSAYFPELFCNIDWGTEQVMQQTQQILDDLGLRHQLLPTFWDVDVADDLEKLVATKEGMGVLNNTKFPA
ncbi:MAG: glycosyltransferase [Methylococcales bacterium]|jgi:uncharacterized protein|nr:glycosyltransferase [Methylococcales bacterium]MBT7408484.1 glycosyltransferase [Methylococcales bacterium]